MLIAARWQRPAWLVVGLALTCVALLAIVVAGYDHPTALDRATDPLAWATLRNDLFDRTDVYFQQLGDLTHLLVLVSVVTLALLTARRWSAAALVVISTVAAGVLSKLVLKPLVGRHYDDVLSFPSTHVSTVSAVMIAVSLALLTGTRRWLPLRLLTAVLLLAVAVTSSVAVVAERTHFTTDALAGWCLALAVVLTTALAIDRLTSRAALSMRQRD